MLEMSHYTLAVQFWSAVVAAGVTLPLAVAALLDLAGRGRREAPLSP